MENENDDEIIIGVTIPKEAKRKLKKNLIKEKKAKKIKEKKIRTKNKARIVSDNTIFRNRIIRKCMIIIFAIIAIILFLSSSVFSVKNIEISGNKLVSKDEIKSLLQVDNGKNIFALNVNDLKNKVKENAYIEDLTLKKKFPSKIEVIVSERKLRYMIKCGEAYVYINNQGYIIDVSNEPKNVPILLGCVTEISELKKGNRLSKDDLIKFDTLNRIYEVACNNDLIESFSKIDVTNIRNITVFIDSEAKTVYLGDCSDLNTRLLYVKAILEQEKGIEGEIFVNVDLNEENVFFREKI